MRRLPRTAVPAVAAATLSLCVTLLATGPATSATSPTTTARPRAGATTSSSSTTSTTARTGRAPETVPGGRVPRTGTTLPLAPVRVRLTAIAKVNQPVALAARPGDDTLFVLEKTGRVRAIRAGVLDPTPVLDLTARVTSENERGLLGIAFKPDDAGRMFIDYTDLEGNVTVSEFAYDGRTADPAGERVLLSIPKPFNEHNAGTLVFDRQGMLLVAIGDGGGGGDQFNNAQKTTVLLGKVLRIGVDPDGKGLPYSIPKDNPFAPRTGAAAITAKQRRTGAPEVWAYGLRNPWRISVDRTTGDVWVPDVGQSQFEEINRMPAGTSGTNFGWSLREGRQKYKGAKPIGAVDPVYDYPHRDGRCAVTGGFVYRGSALPGLTGWYVFGDVCTGQLAALRPDGKRWTPLGLGAAVSYLAGFGEDNDGELYTLSLEGAVSRLDPA